MSLKCLTTASPISLQNVLELADINYRKHNRKLVAWINYPNKAYFFKGTIFFPYSTQMNCHLASPVNNGLDGLPLIWFLLAIMWSDNMFPKMGFPLRISGINIEKSVIETCTFLIVRVCCTDIFFPCSTCLFQFQDTKEFYLVLLWTAVT